MLGTYVKRKEKEVLTKSRTSPDPSEERRASLREFVKQNILEVE